MDLERQRAYLEKCFREDAREEDDLNIGVGWEYAGHEDFHGEGWREPVLNDGADVYIRYDDESVDSGVQYRCESW